ncbi:hypothetical protein J3R30DRAFT_3400236 [Lentinula aciculospora]|uniref:GDP/GTP exchange factor Sec2 N-terminal domain-containing protein n=1 Tax=Lentinula aciculospora TaxID=153920 RepID=A0A9W9DY85_9AGAR|nr:hypothetical protein J3R30DRAFT_3400236 [Lentinula aciculospora]
MVSVTVRGKKEALAERSDGKYKRRDLSYTKLTVYPVHLTDIEEEGRERKCILERLSPGWCITHKQLYIYCEWSSELGMLMQAMFPSTSPSIPSAGKRIDSLNATQRRAPTNTVLSKSRPDNKFGGSLNGTSAAGSNKDNKKVFIPKDEGFFMQVEEELHDLRRVHAHGQEDDLRMALERCMSRVAELVGLLSTAYLALTDVRVELDVTRSNLQMIAANNEMLEDALRSMSNKHGTNPRDVGSVGWRRSGPTSNASNSTSSTPVQTPSSSSTHVNTIFTDSKLSDVSTPLTGNTPPSSPPLPTSESITQAMAIPTPQPVPAPQESRFFKFRFNSSSTASANSSRPQTPVVGNDSPAIGNLTGRHRTESSSSVSLLGGGPSIAGDLPTDSSSGTNGLPSQLDDLRKEFDVLKAQVAKDKADLEAEKVKRMKEEEKVGKVKKEKEDLEAELESLSQALFEEANNMVATERKLRAETESKLHRQEEDLKEELREARAQREALRSALQVVESEMEVLRMGLSGTSVMSSTAVGASGVDTALRSNAPQALDIADPDESNEEEDVPESDYSALPQTASTMSAMSAISSMSAVHGMPGISHGISQPESQPSSVHSHPDPNHPRSSYSYDSHNESHPQSHSRSSSQHGIKSPPSSRPGSRTSRRSGYSEFTGYSRPNSFLGSIVSRSRDEEALEALERDARPPEDEILPQKSHPVFYTTTLPAPAPTDSSSPSLSAESMATPSELPPGSWTKTDTPSNRSQSSSFHPYSESSSPSSPCLTSVPSLHPGLLDPFQPSESAPLDSGLGEQAEEEQERENESASKEINSKTEQTKHKDEEKEEKVQVAEDDPNSQFTTASLPTTTATITFMSEMEENSPWAD